MNEPYITRITARNFKGGDFDLELAGTNCIHGDNFRGKTRILEAIQLALLGHVPAFGAQPREAFLELSSGPEMYVSAEIAGIGKVERKLFAKGNSVKVEEIVPPALADAPTQLVILDPSVYFSLGETDRVRWVFRHCPMPSAFTVKELAQRWPNFKVSEDLLRQDPSPDAYLEGLIESAHNTMKAAKDYADRQGKAIQAITALRSGEVPPEDTLASLTGRRGDIQKRMSALNQRKGELMGRQRELANAAERRGVIARELMGSEKDREKSAELERKLKMVLDELETGRDISDEAVAAARTKATNLFNEKNHLFYSLKQKADERLKLEKQLADLDDRKECPYCGAAGEGWKSLKAAELATAISALEEQLAKETKQEQEIGLLYDTAQAELTSLEDQQRRRRALVSTRESVRVELGSLNVRISRYRALEEERDRLQDHDPDHHRLMEELQGQLNEVAQDSRALEAAISAAEARRGELARLAQLETERDGSRAEQKEAKDAEDQMKELKAKMVEEAFGRLLLDANDITKGILPFAVEYNAQKAQIGTRESGLWRSHRSFSGVEKALTYAGIAAALAKNAPVRIVMIDELGRLTAENARKFAHSISSLVERGSISQFIGIDPERPEIYAECAFQVIPVR